MAAILAHREVAPLLSDEHFSVDGTLIKGEPWCATGSSTMANASMKSFQPKAEGSPPGADGPGDPPSDAPGSGLGGATAAGTETRPTPDAPADTTPDTAPALSGPETAPMACCRFRGHEDRIVTKGSEV